jgi:hypothetical protein
MRRVLAAGKLRRLEKGKEVFFSEEKKQKTFNSGAHGKIPPMTWMLGAAEN